MTKIELIAVIEEHMELFSEFNEFFSVDENREESVTYKTMMKDWKIINKEINRLYEIDRLYRKLNKEVNKMKITKDKFKEDVLHYAIAYADYMHNLNASRGESLERSDVHKNLIKAEKEISNSVDRLFGIIDACDFKFDRYIVNNDGTISDNKTELMWQREYHHFFTLDKAHEYVKNMRLANYTDWRIPTIEEFETILDRSICDPATKLPFMTNDSYLTCSPHIFFGKDCYWTICFLSGTIKGYHKDDSHCFRAVRTDKNRKRNIK